MKKIAATALIVAAAACASSCSSTRVQTDYDHEAVFSNYATFAWYTRSAQDKPPKTGGNEIIDRRIRRAIAENITNKGFSHTAPHKADFVVTYYVSLSSQLRMYSTGWGYGLGYGPYWGYGYRYWPGWGYAGVSTYHESTVIIDIIDRAKGQLIWRGSISRALNKKSSTEQMINDSMARVLRTFPPAG